MAFGRIHYKPKGFEDDWPPPVSAATELKYTLTTEGAAQSMLIGTAHRAGYTKKLVSYDQYGPNYDETIADTTAYNDTLNNVMSTILTSIAEISTLNTTYARAVSPNVTHTVSGNQLAIELASAIAKFYAHLIYIIGSTAYLVDMKLDNGSEIALGFKYLNPIYEDKKPVALARCGDFSRTSSYSYGKEISVSQYHTTQANIETALDDIIEIENKPRCRITVPLRDLSAIPVPGQKISWTDDQLIQDTDAWIRARVLRYDLIREFVTIEGEGSMGLAS